MFSARSEKVVRRIDSIQMRGENDPVERFSRWAKASDEIETAGKDGLEFNVQTSPGSRRREKIDHALLAGARMVRRQKGRIDAGQRNEFAQ